MPKFVSWIPTQSEFIDSFFELAPVSESDIVYDLGSGDGRLLFAALEKGAGKCIGIDIDPERIRDSWKTANSKGIDDKVTFIEADVIDVSLADATLVLCYLFPSASAALKPKFESELKPGAKIVMETFPIPGWKANKTKEASDRIFYLYTMPAEIDESYWVGNISINYSLMARYFLIFLQTIILKLRICITKLLRVF